MCMNCLYEYVDDALPEMTDDIRRAALIVKSIYDTFEGCTGGPLHVILDDYNLEDRYFCKSEEALRELAGPDCPDWLLDLAWRATTALVRLPLPERAYAIALGNGDLSPGHLTSEDM